MVRGSISLGARSLREALKDPETARVMVGIEVYNGGPFSRRGNAVTRPLARELGLAQIASSDAHLLPAIGRGVTAYFGRSAASLRAALLERSTRAIPRPRMSPTILLLRWLWTRALRGLDGPQSSPLPQPLTGQDTAA